jgi:hypothetical protein
LASIFSKNKSFVNLEALLLRKLFQQTWVVDSLIHFYVILFTIKYYFIHPKLKLFVSQKHFKICMCFYNYLQLKKNRNKKAHLSLTSNILYFLFICFVITIKIFFCMVFCFLPNIHIKRSQYCFQRKIDFFKCSCKPYDEYVGHATASGRAKINVLSGILQKKTNITDFRFLYHFGYMLFSTYKLCGYQCMYFFVVAHYVYCGHGLN